MASTDIPNREQIIKSFGKEAADFIEVAASIGWKVVVSLKGQSLALVPYSDQGKRIHLSNRNKGGNLFKRHAKTLARYGDPDLIEQMDSVYGASHLSETAKKAAIQALGRGNLMDNPDTITVLPDEPSKERFVPTPSDLDKRVSQKVEKERHVISERPALMHYNLTQKGGQSYPSKTTVERKWSDGTVDYACAIPTCDKVSDNRRAFGGAHWGKHVRNGEAEPYDENEAKRSIVDDPSYTEAAYSRKQSNRDRRVADLTNLLAGVDLTTISAEQLAEQIVEYLGDTGGGNGNGGEPLTDEQVLDRIRTLVDRGTYAEQETALGTLRREIEDLTQYASEREEALEQDRLVMEQRAIKAESHLTALKDLIGEIKYGEESE